MWSGCSSSVKTHSFVVIEKPRCGSNSCSCSCGFRGISPRRVIRCKDAMAMYFCQLFASIRWDSLDLGEAGISQAKLNCRQRRSQHRLQEFLQRKRGFSRCNCPHQNDFYSSKHVPQNSCANFSSGKDQMDHKDIPPALVMSQGDSRPLVRSVTGHHRF